MSAVLARTPGWPRRLSDLVAERHGAAFAWGSRDCCLWAADAVLALTEIVAVPAPLSDGDSTIDMTSSVPAQRSRVSSTV